MNKYINKIIFVTLLIIAIYPAYSAVDMCVADNSTAIVLDPSIGGSNYSSNSTTATWWTVFNYGTIVGVYACLSSKQNLSQYNVYSANNGVLVDNNVTVTGGEQNGQHCWCKITHPVASLWGFNSSPGSLSVCVSNCASYCGNFVRDNATFRSALFGSVAY